jgi:hypothetical protein
MTRHNRHRAIVQRFGDRERNRLRGLFSQLGTDNNDTYELARGAIDSMLRQFGKAWGAGLIELLDGNPAAIRVDIVGYVAALGSSNSDERTEARRNLAELLARHRKNWSDLTNVLSTKDPREPWACDPPAPDPERDHDLLALVVGLLKDFVEFRGPHEYFAVALWILHTHVYNKFAVTPRLVLRSPVAGCGKTVLLNILARLTARPEKFDFVTAAALYHLIDEQHPCLLIDEADNLALQLQPNGRLRAVFNSGYGASGTGSIWNQAQGSVRKFSTFAPMALALPDAMGGLPRTLNSRSITIHMHRHNGQREVQRLDANLSHPVFDPTYGQILLWLRDPQLKLNPDPAMPEGAHNRLADNWRPLLSIADSVGWGKQAREAMMVFMREYQDADVKIILLGDIRRVFDAQAADRLPSAVLLSALHGMDTADWAEFHGIRGDQQPHKLRSTELASMLRDFGIRPRSVWPANRTAESRSAKGYTRSQFETVWQAYCADDGTTAHTSNIRNLRRADDSTA